MKMDIELAVGFFLLIGLAALGYISVKLGKLELMSSGGYTLYAEFEKAGGAKAGTVIEIAGVEIGRVKSVKLDNYQALVEMTIHQDIKIQDDAIASIRTKGLVGEKYVQIAPGGSDKIIPPGGRLRETESAIDIEEIIAKFAFGKM